MADRSNYADSPDAEAGALPQHRLLIGGAHTKPAGAWGDDTDPALSSRDQHAFMFTSESGDWSWKPERDKRLGPSLVTFTGNRPGAAESFGRTTYHVR